MERNSVKFAFIYLGFNLNKQFYMVKQQTELVLLKKNASPIYTLRTFILLTIFGLSTCVVIVGYSSEQINGVISLFSAVIGYLLGKETPKFDRDRAE